MDACVAGKVKVTVRRRVAGHAAQRSELGIQLCADQSQRTVLSQFGDVASFMDCGAKLIDLASLELNGGLADGT